MLVSSERFAAVLPLPAPWQVDVVSTREGFLALEHDWNRLAERATADHPFCAFDWMRAWWDAFGRGHELHILVVRSHAAVVGIAPLMLTRGRVFGLPVRRLESMANTLTPRFDFLISRDATGVYDAIWRFLQQRRVHWDLLQLSHLPDTSLTMGELRRRADDAGLPTGRWTGDASPYLLFDGGEDAYRRAVGRKHRTNVDRLLRRLAERGPVDLDVFGAPESPPGVLDEGFRLESSGWKSDTGTAILAQPKTEAFYRQLSARHAASGQLRLLFLTSGGQRIAFVYAIRRGNALYLVKCGYDPAFSRYGPVHVLCHLLLRGPRSRGLTTVDFLGANEEWKRRWTHRVTQHVWLYVFRDLWWTRLLCRTKFELVPHLKQRPACRAILSRIRS